MRFVIIYSRQNTAGKNIVEEFKKMSFAPQIPIIELKNKQVIFAEDLSVKKYPRLSNIDFLVFASTHKSEKSMPSLSLHAPGNWRSAELGGQHGKICPTSANVLKFLFQELNKNAKGLKDKYDITLECTHHGPLTSLPCCFIEIGSTEKQWSNKEAGRVIAKTILSLQNYKENKDWIPVIGIGGPHYCPNFNKIQLNSNYAISHIIPQYCLPLTENMLKEAEQKTTEQIKQVLIDWKGCGKSEDKMKIIETIKQAGLKYERTSDFQNVKNHRSKTCGMFTPP